MPLVEASFQPAPEEDMSLLDSLSGQQRCTYDRLRRFGWTEEEALAYAAALPRFAVPACRTSGNLFRGTGDGLDDLSRKRAYALARQAGVNPSGKRYVDGLTREGFDIGADPEAWVDQTDARDQIARTVRKRGWSCTGSVNVTGPPVERLDPTKNYQVADDVVERELDLRLEREKATVSPKERKKEHARLKKELAGVYAT